MKGAGNKSFCAGGDIRSVTDSAKQGNFSPGMLYRMLDCNAMHTICFSFFNTLHVPHRALKFE